MNQHSDVDPSRPTISGWGALVKVLTEPTATFQALGAKPPIFPGYLVGMLAMGAATAVTLPVTMKMTENLMAQQGLPEQAAMIAKWSGIIGGVVGAVGTPWIAGVLIAVAAMFFGQFLGGGSNFGAYLGMAGYARIPLAIGAIIQGLLSMGATSLQEMASKSLSLAVFLPADTNPYLRAAVSTINPFDIWYYILLAIGFTALHRAKPARGVAFVLVVYVVTLLLALSGANAMNNLPPGMQ